MVESTTTESDSTMTYDQIMARVKAEAGDSPEFVYVDYRDELSTEQVAALIEGGGSSSELDQLEEWVDTARYDSIMEWLHDDNYNGCPADLREAIIEADLETDVYLALSEMDTSTPWQQLYRNTGSKLMTYQLTDSNDDEPDVHRCQRPGDIDVSMDEQEAALVSILTSHGIDCTTDKNRAAVQSIIAENAYHGGVVKVVWYGDVEPWINLSLSNNPATITFTDPQVLVWNGWAGAGWFEQFEGEVTVPWHRERITVERGTYGVDACFGLYLPAVGADPKIVRQAAFRS